MTPERYTVYAVFPIGPERVVGTYDSHDEAEREIKRYLNSRPPALSTIRAALDKAGVTGDKTE